MVTNAEAPHQVHRVGLRKAERATIFLLCQLLPTSFRARQHAEWTGDLMELAHNGTSARWRYLLGAAWTLPALRALVRRGRTDGPAAVASVPGSVTTLARVLLVGLGWPVFSWLLAVPVQYALLDAFGLPDRFPTDGLFVLLIPPAMVLLSSAWAAILGGPYLAATTGLAATVLGLAQRRQTRAHRLTTSLLGITSLAVVAMFVFYVDPYASYGDMGITAGLLGCVAMILAVTARSLTRRTRIYEGEATTLTIPSRRTHCSR